jgi:hypothetical protein
MTRRDERGSDPQQVTGSAAKIRLGDIEGTGIVIGHDSSVSVIGEVVLAATLGPFVTAFCTELGRRLGGTFADWTSRVRVRRHKDDPAKAELQVTVGPVVTVIEISESFSDKAKAALLALDLEDASVRGHKLTWDSDAEAWAAVHAARRARLPACDPPEGRHAS